MSSPSQWFNTLPGLGPAPERAATTVEVLPLDGSLNARWGTAEEISFRGLLVRTSRTLPVQSLVRLKLRTGLGQLELSGRVVRHRPGHGMDCIFVHLAAYQQRALEYVLRWSAASSVQSQCRAAGSAPGARPSAADLADRRPAGPRIPRAPHAARPLPASSSAIATLTSRV